MQVFKSFVTVSYNLLLLGGGGDKTKYIEETKHFLMVLFFARKDIYQKLNSWKTR